MTKERRNIKYKNVTIINWWSMTFLMLIGVYNLYNSFGYFKVIEPANQTPVIFFIFLTLKFISSGLYLLLPLILMNIENKKKFSFLSFIMATFSCIIVLHFVNYIFGWKVNFWYEAKSLTLNSLCILVTWESFVVFMIFWFITRDRNSPWRKLIPINTLTISD